MVDGSQWPAPTQAHQRPGSQKDHLHHHSVRPLVVAAAVDAVVADQVDDAAVDFQHRAARERSERATET